MAGFNGSGTYVRSYSWVNDKTNGIDITASRFDTEDNGFATGLSTVICKDGQTTTSAMIPFAQGASVAAGSASAPGLTFISNTSSGLYQPATGQVGVAAAGAGVGLFTSTGLNATNIGATTPGTGNFTTLTATSISGPISANAVGKVAITQPASASTLTVANGKTLTANNSVTLAGGDGSTLAIAGSKTLTVSNSLTLAGTDSTTMTFPGSSDTVVTLGATQTLTNKTLTSPTINTGALGSSTATTQTALDNSTKVATTAYVDSAVSVGGNLKLLSTITMSGTSQNQTITSSVLTGTYNAFVLYYTIWNASGLQGNNTLLFSANNGSTTGGPSGCGMVTGGLNASLFGNYLGQDGGSVGAAIFGRCDIFPGSSTVPAGMWNMNASTIASQNPVFNAGNVQLSTRLNWIEIQNSSGNLNGTVRVYGII